VRPTADNLRRFEFHETLPEFSGGQKWPKASMCDLCPLEDRFMFRVQAGQTLFLPSGWIHAVVTPVDSLVIGGNFLNSFDITSQLYLFQMELRTGTAAKFQFPYFITLNWFALEWLRVRLLHEVEVYAISPKEREQFKYLCVYLTLSLTDYAAAFATDPYAPSSLPYSVTECAAKLREVVRLLAQGPPPPSTAEPAAESKEGGVSLQSSSQSQSSSLLDHQQ